MSIRATAAERPESGAHRVFALLIPPPEDEDPILFDEILRRVQSGIWMVAIISMVLPTGSLLFFGTGLFEEPYPLLRPVRRLIVESNLTILAMGILFAALSRGVRAPNQGRFFVAAFAVVAAVISARIQLSVSPPQLMGESNFFLLLVIALVPYRPLQAFALALASTAAVTVAALFMPVAEGLELSMEVRERVLGQAVPVLFVFNITSSIVAVFLYDSRRSTWLAQVERDRLAKELAASEEKFRSLFEQSTDGIFALDTKSGIVLIANPAVKEILGVEPEELVGRSFLERLQPSEVDVAMEAARSYITGPRTAARFHAKLRREGSTEPVICEIAIHRPDDPDVVSGTIRDVTQQVRLEEEIRERAVQLERANGLIQSAQTKLVQSEKMASLGSLVAGVAHEINTPLGAIQSNADLSRRALAQLEAAREPSDPAQVDAAREKLKRLSAVLREANTITLEATQRIVRIVRELRDFARLDQAEEQMADLHRGLESTLSLLGYIFKNRIRIEKKYGQLPEILCHPHQLNQVFMNLLQNAAQAIDGEGTITLETRVEGRGPAREIVIAIRDTGQGIKPEHLERVFDPGFTTKGVGVGTGLGLSISYQIVQDHKGTITVESELGRGTTFIVRIPARAA